MVKLIGVDPSEVSTDRLGRRGRVIYPIIKQFLEMNRKLCKMDASEMEREPSSLRAGLHSYITKHRLPIKVFSAAGEMYLMRLDIDNDGEPIPDWQEKEAVEGSVGHLRNATPVPVDSTEVARRIAEKKGKVSS